MIRPTKVIERQRKHLYTVIKEQVLDNRSFLQSRYKVHMYKDSLNRVRQFIEIFAFFPFLYSIAP